MGTRSRKNFLEAQSRFSKHACSEMKNNCPFQYASCNCDAAIKVSAAVFYLRATSRISIADGKRIGGQISIPIVVHGVCTRLRKTPFRETTAARSSALRIASSFWYIPILLSPVPLPPSFPSRSLSLPRTRASTASSSRALRIIRPITLCLNIYRAALGKHEPSLCMGAQHVG